MMKVESMSPKPVKRTGLRLRFVWVPACFVLFVLSIVQVAIANVKHNPPHHARALLKHCTKAGHLGHAGEGGHAVSMWTSIAGSAKCDTDFDSSGGPVLLVVVILYSFLGLAIICDDYFVESLEKISARLGLSDDVAGATFMAAGSSAPELMTSTVTTLVTRSVGGVGAIVGSAIFNILCIVGLTAFLAGQRLKIAWYPLTRDTFFYCLAVGLMSWAVSDAHVYWFEGLVLMLGYCLYILFMTQNERIGEYITNMVEKRMTVRPDETAVDMEPRPITPEKVRKGSEGGRKPATLETMPEHDNPVVASSPVEGPVKGTIAVPSPPAKLHRLPSVKNPVLYSENKPCITDAEKSHERQTHRRSDHAHSPSPSIEEATEEVEAPKPLWKKVLGGMWNAFCFPLAVLMKITVPNCGSERWAAWYPLTFTMSIVWIAVFTYAMVDSAERLGRCIGVSDFFMGLLVLAAGTSVPDALSSILVARNGQGDMAVSNALGSNVFDIMLGLGFPWFVQGLRDPAGIAMDCSNDLVVNIAVLALSLMAFVGTLILFKWWLSPRLGITLALLYFLYVVWTVLTGLDIYGLDGNPNVARPVIQL